MSGHRKWSDLMAEQRAKRTPEENAAYDARMAERRIGTLNEIIDVYRSEIDFLRDALGKIADHPLVERNPDGEDQAAHTMQLIAREALEHEKHAVPSGPFVVEYP